VTLSELEQFAERLLLPLVCGAEVRPVPPIGAQRALDWVGPASAADGPVFRELEQARLTAARRLCAIDCMPSLSQGEWLLAFALNDLLQATNSTLAGLGGERRALKLVDMAASTTAHAGAPRQVGEALARHSTFARAQMLIRWDTRVSWWTGSQQFRGWLPPRRLLSWPRVRRVRQARSRVALGAMAQGKGALGSRWRDALSRWTSASPLTDLANFDRDDGMPFAWTGEVLGLLQSRTGRTLAVRVLRQRGDLSRLAAALRASAEPLPQDETRRVVFDFADELEQYARV
jgi:hypothetical protein